MSANTSPAVAQILRHFSTHRPDSTRDAELLTSFATTHDDQAFADLVARHGQLVWGVCARGLTDSNDAEDAFQATFLALARQAKGLVARAAGHESLAGWLYLTARRISHNARRARAKRCEHERRAAADRATEVAPGGVAEPVAELGVVLDEELGRLPPRFRDPLILCYFQGRTHADAARQLDCPVGSVSGLLARGCELLRDRLAHRGVTLAVGQVAVTVALLGAAGRATAGTAPVPVGLVQSLVASARSFAAGGAATTEAGRLALSVAERGGANIKLLCLAVLAAVGMAATAALVGQASAVPDSPGVAVPAVPLVAEKSDRVDASGDPLPDGAVARLGTLRFRTGRMGGASGIAFGADGKQLLSAHATDAIHVWDPVTGRESRRLDAPQYCTGLGSTSDGKRLFAIGMSEVWAWDLAANPPAVLWKVRKPKNIRGNVEVSPDGRVVACGTEGKGEVSLLDAATGEEVRTLPVAGSGLAFASDSKSLAVWVRVPGLHATAPTTVSVWSLPDGKRKYTLEVSENRTSVSAVAFSPDGKTLVTAAEDRRLRTWAASDGEPRATLARDADPLAFVGFLPDGTLVEADRERVRFWDAPRAKQSRPQIAVQDTADARRLSPDGTRLARAGLFGAGAREVATGRDVGAGAGMPDGLVHAVAFTPDSKAAVLAAYSEAAGSSLFYWDAATGKLLRRVENGPKQIAWALDVCSDGAVSAALVPLYQTPSPPTRVVTWEPGFGRERSRIDLPAESQCGAASPDKKVLAVGVGADVLLCDRGTGKVIRALPGKCNATSLAFSADGTALGAIDGPKNTVVIWSLADNGTTTWAPPPGLGKKPASIRAPLALSRDGRLFAVNATGLNGKVRVVEAATGTELWQVDAKLGGLPAQEFTFSPDGRMLAAGGSDGATRVWEVASGGLRYHFPGHRAGVFSVTFSPDSRRLASASYDSTALIWDVAALPQVKAPAALKADDAWNALCGRDADAAYRAIAAMAHDPAVAVPFLRSKLAPKPAPAEQVERWLIDLGAEEFKVREDAARELTLRGEGVLPALKRALAATESAEVRGRLERLIGRLGANSADHRAATRGIEALERMGADPAARQLLRELVKAPADSHVGREARAATERLSQP